MPDPWVKAWCRSVNEAIPITEQIKFTCVAAFNSKNTEAVDASLHVGVKLNIWHTKSDDTSNSHPSLTLSAGVIARTRTTLLRPTRKPTRFASSAITLSVLSAATMQATRSSRSASSSGRGRGFLFIARKNIVCGGAFDFLLDWSCWKIIDELRVKLIQHVRTIEVFIRIELHHLLLYFRLHFLNTCGLCFPLWQRCHRSDECFTAENVQLLCSRMKLGQARRLQGPAEVWIACFAVPFPGRSHRLSHTPHPHPSRRHCVIRPRESRF